MNQRKFGKALRKAVQLTNLCMLHMEYHGQKTKDCTPEERMVVKLAKSKSTTK